MARAYRELGEYDKAKTNSDKALEIKPDYLRAREYRAVVFLKQNKRDGALAELETILGLMPGDTWAKSYRNAIRKYQQDLLNALEDTMQGPMGPFAQPTLVSKIEPQYSEEARGPVSTQGSFADSSSTRMATYRMFTLCAGQGLDWMRRLLKLFMPGYSARQLAELDLLGELRTLTWSSIVVDRSMTISLQGLTLIKLPRRKALS